MGVMESSILVNAFCVFSNAFDVQLNNQKYTANKDKISIVCKESCIPPKDQYMPIPKNMGVMESSIPVDAFCVSSNAFDLQLHKTKYTASQTKILIICEE